MKKNKLKKVVSTAFLLPACLTLAPGTARARNTGGDFGEQVDVKGGEKPYIGGRDQTPQPSLRNNVYFDTNPGKNGRDNEVTFDSVYGGQAAGTEEASYNTVTIGDISSYDPEETPSKGLTDVRGGAPNTGNAIGNTVKLLGGLNSYKTIYGAFSAANDFTGKVAGNTVTVRGGTITGFLRGGESHLNVATENSVYFYNGSFEAESGGALASETGIAGGYSKNASATHNTVVIDIDRGIFGAVSFNAYIAGGYAQGEDNDTSRYDGNKKTAAYNTVTIKNGVFKVTPDGEAGEIVGGYAKTGAAEANTVRIEGGTFNKNNIIGGRSEKNVATGNTVIINGGAFADAGYVAGGATGLSSATNNTVVIGSGLQPDALKNMELYGGYSNTAVDDRDLVIGNTLEVRSKSLIAKSVKNFENYRFIMPAGTANGDWMLNVNDAAFPVTANISVGLAGKPALAKGDTVHLIMKDSAGDIPTDYRGASLRARAGVSLNYDFVLSNTSNTIDATVTGIAAAEESKAVVEARIASIGIANAGADLVAGQAMHNALTNTSAKRGMSAYNGNNGVSVASFAAASGGTQRLESGSYVDVSGAAAVLGLAARKNFDAVTHMGGLFFEFGTSHFSTHNSFASGDVDGSGNASYKGGGLLTRIDVTESPLKGLYLEGVFRFGGMESNWHSDAQRAAYDLYSTYLGAHIGLGYVWQVMNTLKIDFYGKGFWTHLYGDSAYVAVDPYDFADVDSYRMRFGVHTDWNVTERFGIYAGAAWEHEFDGRAQATVYGLDTPAPSIKGNTGVFDLGFSFKPCIVSGLTMKLGATATAGVRHGVAGNLMVKYEF